LREPANAFEPLGFVILRAHVFPFDKGARELPPALGCSLGGQPFDHIADHRVGLDSVEKVSANRLVSTVHGIKLLRRIGIEFDTQSG
jgi:hypothetical protein